MIFFFFFNGRCAVIANNRSRRNREPARDSHDTVVVTHCHTFPHALELWRSSLKRVAECECARRCLGARGGPVERDHVRVHAQHRRRERGKEKRASYYCIADSARIYAWKKAYDGAEFTLNNWMRRTSRLCNNLRGLVVIFLQPLFFEVFKILPV